MPPALMLYLCETVQHHIYDNTQEQKIKQKDIDTKQKLRYYKTQQKDTIQKQIKEEHKMDFLNNSKIGKLENSAIVKCAFEKMMLEKLQSEGYCDINPLLGRPRTHKYEIKNNLNKLNSPLAKVFARKYATNTKELEEIMLPVLKEMEEKASEKINSLDGYIY